MLSHDYTDMPGKGVGDSPHETQMLLRCRFCLKRPAKAREDGCPVRELQEVGQIVLSEWNPQGVGYFNGRRCVTCEQPIMSHWLRNNLTQYFCYENQNQFSYGVEGCGGENDDLSDVQTPVEPVAPRGSI